MLDVQWDFHHLQHIHGIIGAIDGSHIPIKAPLVAKDAHLNRKKFYSVILQAVCDETFFSLMCLLAGLSLSVHDARVFLTTVH